ncbi:MAG: beta-propeller fold lactonase family protein [Wenzhouxiangellaceae bacterium]|nr:beta-propeller fold lactonase family protein [Wenzhouxiangellaceae bacterium]
MNSTNPLARAVRACRLTRWTAILLLLLPAHAAATVDLVTDFTAPAQYTPGETGITYTIRIDNTGTTDAANVDIDTNFPAGVTLQAVSCADDGGMATSCSTTTNGGNLASNNSDIAAGGFIEFTLSVDYASSLTVDPLYFDVLVTDTDADTFGGDGADSCPMNTCTIGSALDLVSDLGVAKTADSMVYVPGQTGTFSIVVSNDGPSDASGVTLTDTLPAGTSVDDWACSGSGGASCPASLGTGNTQTFDIVAGGSLDFTLTLAYPSSLTDATLTNAAAVSADVGTTSGTLSNTDTADVAREAHVDLSASVTTSGTSYIPGSTGNTATVTIANAGPSDAIGASVVVALPVEVESARWDCPMGATCSPAGGDLAAGEDITVDLDVAASGSVAIALTQVDYDSGSLLDPLEITATPSPASGDVEDDAMNDAGTLSLSIDRRADLQVTKVSSATTVNPGDAFMYTITVTNLGPSDVGNGPGEGGARLIDDVPGELLGDPGEARCTADSAAPCFLICPSDEGVNDSTLTPDVMGCPVEIVEHRGDLTSTSPAGSLRLSSGSSTEVLLFVSLSGGVENGSQIVNEASVQVDSADPVTELNPMTGNSDPATIDVEISTDLVVTKTDGVTAATPGQSHSYTVTVLNDGIQAANGVRVSDTVPLYPALSAGFVQTSVEWQCRAFGGACCNSGTSSCGTNSPTTLQGVVSLSDHLVDLPGQGRVEFTLTGDLDRRSTGTLTNAASAMLPAGIEETDTTNNDASDDTLMVEDSLLQVSKDLIAIADAGGGRFLLTYIIDVANLGPSFAAGAMVSDPLNDASLDRDNATTPATWTCTVQQDPNGGSTCESGTGALAATVDIDVGGELRFRVEVLTTATPAPTVLNEVTVNAPGGMASDSIESSLTASAELSVTKTDGLMQAVPGRSHQYTITVQNVEGDPVFGARVVDEFPPELENVTWACEAITPIPGDLEEFDAVGPTGTPGGAIVASADGLHVYQLIPELDSLQPYLRNNVPGLNFGAMNEIADRETNGVDDSGDAGPVVENMEGPVDLAISPDGRHVYVLSKADPMSDSQNAIAVFSRQTSPTASDFGQLSFAGSATEGIPADPRSLVVTADNLFVAGDAGAVSVYARNDATGLATFVETQTSGVPADPSALALDAADGLLFAGSGSGQGLAVFSINDDDSMGDPIGRLTLIDTLTSADHAGISDLDVFAATDDLYVSAAGSENVVLVRYGDTNADGVPDPFQLAVYAVPGITSSTLAPDGEHLLAVGASNDTLTRFRRDIVSGTLSEKSVLTRSFDSATPPQCIDECTLAAPVDVLVTSDGRHVLVSTSEGGAVPALAIYTRRAPDPLFALIETDRDSDPGVGDLESPTDVAVSPDGQHVYAVSLSQGSVSLFQRNADAGLTEATAGTHLEFVADWTEGDAVPGGVIAGMSAPEYVLVSPDGSSVFVSSEDGNSVAVFKRLADGSLEFLHSLIDGVDGVEGLAGARGMAMDAQSKNLYVAGGFDASVAVFRRESDLTLTWIGRAQNGVGFNGLTGVRDVAVSPDGAQVYAVADIDDALVAMRRDNESVDPDQFGNLSFLQTVISRVGDRPMAVTVSPGDGDHVYVASQNSDSVSVFRRVSASGDDDYGKLTNARQQFNGEGAITFMNGPRDIEVSPDGKRVYVAAQFDSSLLVFDRDLNRNGANFGALAPVAVSRDDVNGVDGLDNIYALAVSHDSRNVYAAGFDDRAIASFVLGIGSVCTGGGSGMIDDTVTIGVGGFVQYRIEADIRPDATGTLTNTVTVTYPENVTDPNQPGVDRPTVSATDTTQLIPQADLALTKTNNQVSVVAGQPVTYEIRVTNLGPSNVTYDSSNLTVTDLFDGNPDFEPGSVAWSCVASSSGALTFAESIVQDPTAGAVELGLDGVASIAVVPDPDGAGPLTSYLVAASVVDDGIVVFGRAPGDGALTHLMKITDGDALTGGTADLLAGARSVVASPDGRFLYVASQIDDAVTVFELTDNAGALELVLVQSQSGMTGLNQASHVALGASGDVLYVAGSNDDAIAVFSRNAASGELGFLESERDGIDDPDDAGGTVTGLDGVVRLVASPDGAHLYAVSATDRAVATFDVAADGYLSWVRSQFDADLGVDLSGAGGAAMDTVLDMGTTLYVSAGSADRIVVLDRDADPASGTYGVLSVVEEIVQGVNGVSGLLGPRDLVVSKDGAHVYAVAQTSGAVSWYLRDAADGSLDFGGVLSNESSFVTGLGGASAVAIDDALGQVYVAGSADAAVSRFRRNSDSSCPASDTGELNGVAVDIAAGGSVVFQVTATVAATTDGELQNTATVSADPGVDINDTNDSQTDTDQVEVVADLRISKDDGLAEYDGLDGATALAGDARAVYTAGREDDAIGVFRRTVDPGGPEHGELNFTGVMRNGEAGVSGLTDVSDLALSVDRAHLYATGAASNTLVAFDRVPTTGALAFVELEQNGTLGVNGIGGAEALAVSPDDEHVYVAGRLDNSIAVFRREADPMASTYGDLEFVASVQNAVGGVTNLTEPVALTVSPDGLHVYAVSSIDNSVVVFQRNPNPGSSAFGSLSYVDSEVDTVGGVAGLAGAIDVLVAPDGMHVYVLGATTGTLARFSRDPGTGALTFIDFKQDGTAGTTGLAGAAAMRLSSDAAQVYVAGAASDAVVRFDVLGDASLEFAGIVANGDAAPLTGGQVQGLDGVADVLPSPDGEQLYAVGSIDDALATFQRDLVTDPGALSFSAALFDGLGGVAPGSVVTYRIIVENLGPSDVGQITVVDDFPDTFSAISWTCTPSANPAGACTQSGTGSINDSAVSLEAGARVTYVANATVREDATGRLVNTATVTGAGLQDPVIANNTATDDDTVLSPSVDLVVDVDDGMTVATPGEPVEYLVTVDNVGPSFAVDVLVSDAIPAALYDVTWSCSATPVEGVLTQVQMQAQPLDGIRDIVVSGDGLFAYAAGAVGGSGAVAAFLRDPVSGALTPLESWVEGGPIGDGDMVEGLQGVTDLLLSENGNFLYAAGSVSDAIVIFARDAQSGLLTQVGRVRDGESGVDGIGGVTEIVLGPAGVFLYAAGRLDDAVAVFRIDGASGNLLYAGQTVQGIGGVDGLNGVTGLAWSDGHLLAVADENASLAAFERSATTGLLTQVAILQNFELGPPNPPAPLNSPLDVLAVGTRVFVAAGGGNAVSEFEFVPAATVGAEPVLEFVQMIEDGVDGITDLAGPATLAYSERQQRLYVGSPGSETIHLFSLRDTAPELLAQYGTADIPALAGLTRLVIPFDGPLYSLADPGAIGVLARRRGSLCALGGAREIGEQPVEIAPGGRLEFLVGGVIHPNASGQLIYSVEASSRFIERELNPSDNADDDIDTLGPVPDLRVTKTDGLDEVVAGTGITYTIDFDNAGPSDALGALFSDVPPIFPPEDPGLVSGSAMWACTANPPLVDDFVLGVPDFAELAGASALRFSPDGTRLLVANPELDTVLVFDVDALDGSLALAETFSEGMVLGTDPEDAITGLVGASAAALSRDGDALYATGADANSLVVLTRDAEGTWRFEQQLQSGQNGVSGLQGPQDVILSAEERFVFVAAAASDAITVFSREASTGRLTFVERVRDGFGTITPDFDVIRGVRRLHATADGKHLYVVAPVSDSVAAFAIDPDDGTLTYLEALQAGDPGVTGMAGAWDLVAAPGDDQLYVAARDGDAITTLLADPSSGLLSFADSLSGAPIVMPESLAIDAAGSRLYASTADGIVHVLARDWIDGSLEYRGAPVSTAPMPTDLAVLDDPAGLYAVSPAAGSLARFGALPLSRCLVESGTSDAVMFATDVGAGGYGQVIYEATVHPAARGVLVNLAELLPAIGMDADSSDNTGLDSTTVIAVSDLAVTKTGPAQAVAGEVITYDITVTNAGPSDALGIVVTDTPPVPLGNIQWTCSASADSICPASGSGTPMLTATVRVGGQLDITVSGTIDPAFIGLMTNVVTVTPEPGSTDPTTGDLVDDVSTTVVARPDLVATKTTLTSPVVAGLPVQYSLVAANAGPSDAPTVHLSDMLPGPLANATWTCSGSGGATCPASGTGDPEFDASVPAGGAVEVIVTADLAPNAVGTLGNLLRVDVRTPAIDPDIGNNTSSTSDVISVVPDVALALEDPLDPFDPAGPIGMPYLATLTNTGPSSADGLLLTLNVSAPITPESPGCVNAAPEIVECQTGPLGPGQSKVFNLTLFDLPAAPATLVIDGVVVTSGDDPDLSNNVDSTTTLLRTGADIDVTLDNARTWLSPDEPVSYALTVRNIGSVDAGLVDVSLPIAAELLDAGWTCAGSDGASCPGSGTGPIAESISMPSGAAATWTLTGRVDPALDLSVPQSVLMSALAETADPASDINAANNLAVDDDPVRLVMFSDGFESPVRAHESSFEIVQRCTEITVRPAGDAGPRRLEGFDAGGEALFWLDLRRHDDHWWTRMVTLSSRSALTSGWLGPVDPSRGATVRIDDARPLLTDGERLEWMPASSLRSSPAGLRMREPGSTTRGSSFGIAGCDAASAAGGGDR